MSFSVINTRQPLISGGSCTRRKNDFRSNATPFLGKVGRIGGKSWGRYVARLYRARVVRPGTLAASLFIEASDTVTRIFLANATLTTLHPSVFALKPSNLVPEFGRPVSPPLATNYGGCLSTTPGRASQLSPQERIWNSGGRKTFLGTGATSAPCS